MPRYFINIRDGVAVIDDEGTELPTIEAACEVARRRLIAMLQGEDGGGKSASATADIRDRAGKLLRTASLAFNVREHG